MSISIVKYFQSKFFKVRKSAKFAVFGDLERKNIKDEY